MKFIYSFLLFTFIITVTAWGQNDSTAIEKNQKVYDWKNKLDIPLTAGAAGVTIFNFSQIFSKDRSSVEKILSLDPNDVNNFDRDVAGNYDVNAKRASNVLLGASFAVPLVIFALDDSMKSEYRTLSLLYLEAISFTGLAYSTSQQFNNRYRPYAYNEDLELAERTLGGAKNSFYSGHTAVVATSAFFMARVWNDYHPDSPYKWISYSVATTITVATGYLRVKAGQHFPTDVIVGGIMGAASGFLVPYLHKKKVFKDKDISLLPLTGQYHGLRFSYTF